MTHGQVDGPSSSLDVIVASARRLFYERGFDATSMQDVADDAGMHKSSLYHYFRAKDDLLEVVCRDTFRRLEASLDAVLARTDLSLVDRVIAAIEGAADVALSDVPGTNIILSQRETRSVGQRIHGWRRQYDLHFSELVRAAQAAGEVRNDIDPVLLTRLVLGTINWAVVWYRPEQVGFAPEAIRQAVTLIISEGIPARPGGLRP